MRRARQIVCAVLAAVMMTAAVHTANAQTVLSPLSSATLNEPAGSKPRVIVEDYAVTGGGLVSGAGCELTVTLRNTSSTQIVSSVLVTGRWSNDAPPVDFEHANQVFAGVMGPSQTADIVFSLKTQPTNISALDAVVLYLDISYSYGDMREGTNSVMIHLPVTAVSPEESPGESAPANSIEPTREPSWTDGLNIQLICAVGSVVCAFAAAVLVMRRRRQ